jgi:hypothetical protein
MSTSSGSDSDTKPSKEDLRLQAAEHFLNRGKNFKIMYDLLVNRRYKKLKMSIRMLEWFVVTYSQKHDVYYELEEANGTSSEPFSVNKSYQNQLGIYTKRAFDPFCRAKKKSFNKVVKVEDDEGNERKERLALKTSVAQVNFFNWALTNKVLDYIADNYVDIMHNKKQSENARRDAKRGGSAGAAASSSRLIDSSSSSSDDDNNDSDVDTPVVANATASSSSTRAPRHVIADSDSDNDDSDEPNAPRASTARGKKGARSKRKGTVVIRHFSRGITYQMP